MTTNPSLRDEEAETPDCHEGRVGAQNWGGRRADWGGALEGTRPAGKKWVGGLQKKGLGLWVLCRPQGGLDGLVVGRQGGSISG